MAAQGPGGHDSEWARNAWQAVGQELMGGLENSGTGDPSQAQMAQQAHAPQGQAPQQAQVPQQGQAPQQAQPQPQPQAQTPQQTQAPQQRQASLQGQAPQQAQAQTPQQAQQGLAPQQVQAPAQAPQQAQTSRQGLAPQQARAQAPQQASSGPGVPVGKQDYLLEFAACTIQRYYRGYKCRTKYLKQVCDGMLLFRLLQGLRCAVQSCYQCTTSHANGIPVYRPVDLPTWPPPCIGDTHHCR